MTSIASLLGLEQPSEHAVLLVRKMAFHLGSFNMAIILLSNFYTTALTGNQEIPPLLNILVGGVLFPLSCLGISFSLYRYLNESIDREIVRGILIGVQWDI